MMITLFRLPVEITDVGMSVDRYPKNEPALWCSWARSVER